MLRLVCGLSLTLLLAVGSAGGVSRRAQAQPAPPTFVDTDGDGYSDLAETNIGADPKLYCPIMRADVDNDGSVSVLDLAAVAGAFLQAVPPANARYDQDHDNTISILDLAAMASHFLQSVTACPQGAPLTINGSGSGSGSVALDVAGASTCTLTTGVAGSGCTPEIALGTAVTLTASTNASSQFSAWTGQCDSITANVCSLTLNAARTVSAAICGAHDNGLGQTYFDCAALDTYNQTTATEAALAWTGGGPGTGPAEAFECFDTLHHPTDLIIVREGGTTSAAWDYSGTIAVGHVEATSGKDAFCPIPSDPAWN